MCRWEFKLCGAEKTDELCQNPTDRVLTFRKSEGRSKRS